MQSSVQNGEIVLYRGPIKDNEEEGMYFARLMWAKGARVLFVDGLPEGHWAEPHIHEFFGLPVKIGGRQVASDTFHGTLGITKVKLMENLSVTMEGQTVPLIEAVVVGDPERYRRGAILFPFGEDYSTWDALRQASSYQDESDNIDFDALERDQERLIDLLAIMAGEAPEVTVKKCLLDAGAHTKSNLKSCGFHIAFDTNGCLSVTRCQQP